MMDPIPQDCVSTSDVASYGTTAPPFIDTRSEPPAYYRKAAELVNNKHNSNSAPASKSGYSISGTQSVQSVDPPPSKSTTKGGAKSRNESGGQIMSLSDKISNDKSSTHYYKQQQQKSIKSKTSNSRKGMTKSSLVSNATESNISSSKSKGTRTSTKSSGGSTLKRQQSIDPPTNSPESYYNDDETEVSGAIYGTKSPGSIAAQEDPPSVCSDPPSICDSTSSYGSKSSRGGSSRRSSSSSTRKSTRGSTNKSLRNQQPPSSSESILHTWNEEEDTDDDDGEYIAQEHRSIDSPDKDDEDDISSNNSSKDYSYEEGEEEDEETRCSELANAVEHALAIRRASIAESDPIHISDASSDQLLRYNTEEGETVQENAIALMESDDYNGVNSYYGNEDEEGGESTLQSRSTSSSQSRNSQQIVAASLSSDSKTSSRQIVPKQQNYLSKAVDNYNAVVPIDSNIYEAYDHTFVTCPENLRFRFLYTFLKKNMDKKIMVFFSTTNSAKYHAKLLEHFHVPTLVMHGKQRRERFINQFFKFSDLEEGILCATDAAGRDLDIPPSVDWVVQFEPPEDPSEYILRVARISCNSDRVGRSLLFLNPGEKSGFLKYYHSASIPVSEFEIPSSLADVQSHIEYHVNESERLLRYAKDAYGSYLIAYASHGFRDVYNVHDLQKEDVAIAFGIVESDTHDDDKTAETDTLATPFSCVGGDSGLDKIDSRRSGSGRGDRNKWEKKEKSKNKSWMKGEKSWPHSQIKMHPKFKSGHAVQEEGY